LIAPNQHNTDVPPPAGSDISLIVSVYA